MRKNFKSGVIMVLSAVLMTGCGNTIPEMTEEEQELVVEYAANTLLKYDKYYERKLIELTLEQELAEDTVPKEEAMEETEEKPEKESSLKPDSEVTIIDNTGDAVSENISIQKFLGLDSVEITYTGNEVCDAYPEQGEDLFFIMNATAGNKLLVLKFQVKNVSGTETELDIAQSNTRFKVVVDGKQTNALTTMLLNDLAYYKV
ncbi:MAG: hypothetical protein K2P30_16365, partial [Lachnospiraceae bacterium]|nr:hypothetical protein [Lachnospiraceae bacterium]